MTISRDKLEELCVQRKLSQMEISRELGIGYHKVRYWFDKYSIPRRSISAAIYQKYNPNADPFEIKTNLTPFERELRGLGLGLYWGEGTKKNKHSIRLGNTDPNLIKTFIEFLIVIYNVKKERLKFGLQIFSDMDPKEALTFWC